MLIKPDERCYVNLAGSLKQLRLKTFSI